ncbi:MAG: sorbosone dehydrogenase family protein, partial [Planctomycetota bacterium]
MTTPLNDPRDPDDRARPNATVLTALALAGCVIVACVALLGDRTPPVAQAGPDTADPSERFRRDDGELGSYRTEKAFPKLASFQRPLCIVQPPDAPDGKRRFFVCEQHGVISSFEQRPDVAERKVCLDISAKTRRNNNEEGLLGMAFHPRFPAQPYIYIHYSTSGPTRGVVSRFTMDASGTVAEPASELVLLEQKQPFGNHNGGAVVFGPDGYLYLTFGDGGAANDPYDNGQWLGTWLAKMLRIDVDRRDEGKNYAVPADNPFVGVDGALPEIWAYGLRNLWRVTFDSASGLCIGSDVGQNAWEEVVIIERGKNYGWRAKEGFVDFRGPARGREHKGPYVDPIHVYGRRDGYSITGGYIYRGTKLPGLQGAYVYCDYTSGNIWALRYDGQK